MISSSDLALRLVSEIQNPDVRRVAEKSLRNGANMNLMVRAFHQVYGLPIITPDKAQEDFSHIPKERLAMRFGLIVEEFMELCEAMDIRADINFYYQDEDGWQKPAGDILGPQEHNNIEDKDLHEIVRLRAREAIMNTDERSMPDIADACFDLKYVIIGFEYEVGIEPQFCAEEGQASNMSKLNTDGTVIYREDGKVLKGPKFFRPDMSLALKAWGMRGV